MASILRISEGASMGLHAIVLMAGGGGDPVSVKRAAAAILGGSANHLAKVMQRLAKVGLVKSTRGPSGGFVLAKPADSIRLLDVYEAIDGKLDESCCLFGKPMCGAGKCIFKGLIETLNKRVMDYFGGTRLASLKDAYARVLRGDGGGSGGRKS